MWTGVAVIVTSGRIDLAWRHLRRKNLDDVSVRELYLLGITVHIAMLLWFFLMPLPTALAALSKIGAPVMLIFPAGTVQLGRFCPIDMRVKKSEHASGKPAGTGRYLFDVSGHDLYCRHPYSDIPEG